jgi:hypothetical protein
MPKVLIGAASALALLPFLAIGPAAYGQSATEPTQEGTTADCPPGSTDPGCTAITPQRGDDDESATEDDANTDTDGCYRTHEPGSSEITWDKAR